MACRVPGGPGETRLLQFCNSFGYRPDDNLHIFYSEKDTPILYRHGTAGVIKKNGKEYPQWRFKKILGNEEECKQCKYVLLHGPASIKDKIWEEGFWIVSKSSLQGKQPQELERLNLKATPDDYEPTGHVSKLLMASAFVKREELKDKISWLP